MPRSLVRLEGRAEWVVGNEAEQAGAMHVQVLEGFAFSEGVRRGFYTRGDMVRSVIEEDELESKMDRRGPGGGREGSEEAGTMVQERG